MSRLLWLDDEAWAAIEPHLPKNQPGARRVDDRRVISGILHLLKAGCRWQDCLAEYGPPTTISSRFNRWSRRKLWSRILDALVARGVLALSASIDSSYVKGLPLRPWRSAKHRAKAQAIGPSRGAFFGSLAHLVERRAFLGHLSPVRKKHWVVYAKAPFAVPEAVLAYLSRYTHRVAISNRSRSRLPS